MSKKCILMLYLHMHQPYYKELRTERYQMPWTRLHALRNYGDMPALHREFEGLKITYNLVPAMLEQINDYAAGAVDDFLEISRKNAAELTLDDKKFILSNFFQLNRTTQIDEFPRFAELLGILGNQSRKIDETSIPLFKEQDLRDLQVLFNLAWSGWLIRETPEIKLLMQKGRNFSEEDKQVLFKEQQLFLPKVIEQYRIIQSSNMGELTASPYYHPILPLLCDSSSALQSVPGLTIPKEIFSYPLDADAQIKEAVVFHQQLFGEAPTGMWPSEGSISAKACSLMADNKISWVASDQAVLANSLGKTAQQLSIQEKYSPWLLETEKGPLKLYFRDTEFSDLIGFTYQHWSPERASKDFVQRLARVKDQFPGGQTPVISVILDGENAWSYYANNGRQFLKSLYQEINSTPWLTTATPKEINLMEAIKPQKLDNLVAGSWIYGNLTTWIGYPEKNRAWELLTMARKDFEALQDKLEPEKLEKARKELFISEGSDWFWWFGDDHHTNYAQEFDSLFREHLKNIYRFMDQDPPSQLLEPIKKVFKGVGLELPIRLMTPLLDGYESSYLEWANAGIYSASGAGDAMHKTTGSPISKILFGYDADNLYLRIDAGGKSIRNELNNYQLAISFTKPEGILIQFDFQGNKPPALFNKDDSANLDFGCAKFLELAIPWERLGKAESLSFYLTLIRDGDVVETYPGNRVITLTRHENDLNALNWYV